MDRRAVCTGLGVNPIKKKAATGLHPSDGQTENQDKEPIAMNSLTDSTDNATAPRTEADREWMKSLREEFGLPAEQLARELDITVTYLTALEDGSLPLSRTMYRRIARAITYRPHPTVHLDCVTPGCNMFGLGHVVSRIDYYRGESVTHKAFEDNRDEWQVQVTLFAPHTTWGVWTAFETDTDPGTTCEAWAEYTATVTGAFQLAGQLNAEAGR